MNKGRTFHEETLKITIEGDISRVKMEELMVHQIAWLLEGGSEVQRREATCLRAHSN